MTNYEPGSNQSQFKAGPAKPPKKNSAKLKPRWLLWGFCTCGQEPSTGPLAFLQTCPLMTDTLVLRGTKRPSCSVEKQGNGARKSFWPLQEANKGRRDGAPGAVGTILILLSFSLILVPPPKLTRICLCKPEDRNKPWVSLPQLTCMLEERLTRQTYLLTIWGRQSACGQPATEIVIKGGKNWLSFSGLEKF